MTDHVDKCTRERRSRGEQKWPCCEREAPRAAVGCWALSSRRTAGFVPRAVPAGERWKHVAIVHINRSLKLILFLKLYQLSDWVVPPLTCFAGTDVIK